MLYNGYKVSFTLILGMHPLSFTFARKQIFIVFVTLESAEVLYKHLMEAATYRRPVCKQAIWSSMSDFWFRKKGCNSFKYTVFQSFEDTEQKCFSYTLYSRRKAFMLGPTFVSESWKMYFVILSKQFRVPGKIHLSSTTSWWSHALINQKFERQYFYRYLFETVSYVCKTTSTPTKLMGHVPTW